MRSTKPHYLSDNKKVFTPHYVAFLDTEARANKNDLSLQFLTHWVMDFVIRHDQKPTLPRVVRYEGKTRESLVDAVEGLCKHNQTVWLGMHNNNYDLAVTRLPQLLIERGWELGDNALFSNSPWAYMKKGSHAVRIYNTFSFLPVALADIGENVGIKKVFLPDEHEDDAAWFRRCRVDVDITRTAMLQVMDWWDKNELGNFSMTGPSSGFNVYRHNFKKCQPVIDPDPIRREFERGAIYSGMRGITYQRAYKDGLYLEIDFNAAHLQICFSQNLPIRKMREFASLPLDSYHFKNKIVDCIAEVIIKSDRGCYPVNTGKGIFYPVGTFKTVLPGPEILEARERGELVSIGRGYMYQVGQSMAFWAAWMAKHLTDEFRKEFPAVYLMLKSWSRSVPGKWATKTSVEERRVETGMPEWRVEPVYDAKAKSPGVYMDVGGERILYIQNQEAENTFPGVLAFIQSYMRVYLQRLREAIGAGVIQWDTDGCIVDAAAWLVTLKGRFWGPEHEGKSMLSLCQEQMKRINEATRPLPVRIKDHTQDVTILGAQHRLFGDKLKLSGISKHARDLGGYRFKQLLWPKLPSQLNMGTKEGFRLKTRITDVSNMKTAAWRMLDGQCIGVTMALNKNRENEILPPSKKDIEKIGIKTEGEQHPILGGILKRYWQEHPGEKVRNEELVELCRFNENAQVEKMKEESWKNIGQ